MTGTLNNTVAVRDVGPQPYVARLNTLTASATIDANYDGSTVLLSAAAGQTLTLPKASGTGNKYRFFVRTTVTSNSAVIKVGNTTDSFIGAAIVLQDAGSTVIAFEVVANDDTITLNGSTTGGIIGDFFEIEDIAAGLFRVNAVMSGTGTEATPFSATV